MLPISSEVTQFKNDISSSESAILMLEIDIPNEPDPIRVCRNNEDVTWRTYLWQAFPFDIDDIKDDGSGEVPEFNIRVANASRAMEQYLQAYNLWLKENGIVPISVNLYVISTADLANTDPIVQYSLNVSKFESNAEQVTFTLSFENFYTRRFPHNMMMRNSCRWAFGSTECGYTPSVGETCNRTLTACRSYNNSTRFGAFPSVGGNLSKVFVG